MQRWAPAWARAKLPPGTDRWLFIKSSYSWFPRFGDGFGDRAADVDLIFHAPKRYRLASIGRLVGSSVEGDVATRSEEHTSELQSQSNLVCRLLLEKKK